MKYYLTIPLILIAAFYTAFSLYYAEFDPMMWSINGRFLLALAIILSAFLGVGLATEINERQNGNNKI